MTVSERKIQMSCLIDDDKIYLFSVRKLIEHYKLCEKIIEFNNGLDALTYFQNVQENDSIPDIIFLDINMPIMNGWEFLEEFIKIKPNISKPVTIYMVSSSIDSRDMEKALSFSAVSNYLIKPASIKQLKDIFEQQAMQNS
jgi:response regulator RpfG family c-di-GMP phosphodiesterase